MKRFRHGSASAFRILLVSLLLLWQGTGLTQEASEDLLPAEGLFSPDEIGAWFSYQHVTPFGVHKYSFEILIPKGWISEPLEASEADLAGTEAGEGMLEAASFTPGAEDEKDIVIDMRIMRVPKQVKLKYWMDLVLPNLDCPILARQTGEHNGRAMEEALLRRDSESGAVLTRFTAYRRGDYIFVVAGTAAEDQYPKYKRTLALTAASFDSSVKR